MSEDREKSAPSGCAWTLKVLAVLVVLHPFSIGTFEYGLGRGWLAEGPRGSPILLAGYFPEVIAMGQSPELMEPFARYMEACYQAGRRRRLLVA